MARGKGARSRVTLPNLLSFWRLLSSPFLLVTWDRPLLFALLYLLVGVSDLLDGTLARKLGQVSDFGAKLDSIADLVFYLVFLALLFLHFTPYLTQSLWWMIVAIVFLRFLNMLMARVKYERFVFIHTLANKLTGLLVFFIPLLLLVGAHQVALWGILGLAHYAALEEISITLRYQEVYYDRKSVFHKHSPKV